MISGVAAALVTARDATWVVDAFLSTIRVSSGELLDSPDLVSIIWPGRHLPRGLWNIGVERSKCSDSATDSSPVGSFGVTEFDMPLVDEHELILIVALRLYKSGHSAANSR